MKSLRVAEDVVYSDREHLEREGFVIMRDLFDADAMKRLKEALTPLCAKRGRNEFEGHLTQRVYALVAACPAAVPLVEHPRVLALLSHCLLPNFLLSACQAINILPGEKPQLLHYDDAFIPIPRPREPFGAATVYAIDDFTAENGATVVLPGSHRWSDRIPTYEDEIRRALVPAVMPAGSAIFFLSTLWHGGGANRSASSRLAVTAQYCQPYLRPQENMCWAVPRELTRRLSPAMQSMLGYSVHPPFIGQVGGLSPLQLLERD